MLHIICTFCNYLFRPIIAFFYFHSRDIESGQVHTTFETSKQVKFEGHLSDPELTDDNSSLESTSDSEDSNSSIPHVAWNSTDSVNLNEPVCEDTLRLFIEFVRESRYDRQALFQRMESTGGWWIPFHDEFSSPKNVESEDTGSGEESDLFDLYQDAMEGEVDYLPHPEFLHMAQIRAQCLAFEIHGHMDIFSDDENRVRTNPNKHIKWADVLYLQQK